MSPALASWAVWLAKLINLLFDGKADALHRLEVLIWALVSVTMSSFWRLATDEKTLATGDKPHSAMTRFLLWTERCVAVVILLVLVIASAKGAERCYTLGVTPVLYFAFVCFPVYLLVGFFATRDFREDRVLITAAEGE